MEQEWRGKGGLMVCRGTLELMGLIGAYGAQGDPRARGIDSELG